jgi:hypothetical protein
MIYSRLDTTLDSNFIFSINLFETIEQCYSRRTMSSEINAPISNETCSLLAANNTHR